MKTSPPPPVLDLGHHPKPELGPFGLLNPETEDFFVTFYGEAQGQVNRLIAHRALVPDFNPERIKNNDRVNFIQRPVLPFPNLVHDLVGDPRD